MATFERALRTARKIAHRYGRRVYVYGARERRCTCPPSLKIPTKHVPAPDGAVYEYYLRHVAPLPVTTWQPFAAGGSTD